MEQQYKILGYLPLAKSLKGLNMNSLRCNRRYIQKMIPTLKGLNLLVFNPFGVGLPDIISSSGCTGGYSN
jgi:hypothetical protein